MWNTEIFSSMLWCQVWFEEPQRWETKDDSMFREFASRFMFWNWTWESYWTKGYIVVCVCCFAWHHGGTWQCPFIATNMLRPAQLKLVAVALVTTSLLTQNQCVRISNNLNSWFDSRNFFGCIISVRLSFSLDLSNNIPTQLHHPQILIMDTTSSSSDLDHGWPLGWCPSCCHSHRYLGSRCGWVF